MQEVRNWQKLTIAGKVFHYMGIFLMRRTVGQQVALFLRAYGSLFNRSRSFRADTKNIIAQAFFTGVEIFPILCIVATLFGAVVIMEILTLMGKMGFDDVMGSIMVIVVIRELGPILTAFLIAGRSGSSLTTYIGSMVIDSEVDALATMGVAPIRYLVMPGIIGGTISTFVMTIFFSATAICCGYLTTRGLSLMASDIMHVKLTWSYLSTEILDAMSLSDFFLIILKPLVFGSIITTNACYQALNIPHDIRQVPKATSRSVIKSFLYIVVADVIMSIFYFLSYMNELSKII